jgi:cyclopropane-fatty-acyl-phospholipid synthase
MTTDTRVNYKTGVFSRDEMLFSFSIFLLNRIIRDSEVTMICRTTGQTLTAGKRGKEKFSVIVNEPRTLWEMVTNPDPGAGEMFMAHQWEMESGDIGAFITMMARNLQAALNGPAGFLLSPLLHKKLQVRPRDLARSKDYIEHHYDIGNDLYETFLDEGMNYSCAFFTDDHMTLREAQLNKIRTVIARLGIAPGMKVLDIGCGWGEACRVVAETGAAGVTGVTLAANQLQVAIERAKSMKQPPVYLLEDYRQHAATHENHYDRIFSIGMFEHVGQDQYRTYFSAIKRQLVPGGRALIHSIVNAGKEPGLALNSPWLEEYIFPGGRLPDLPEILEAARLEGLRLAHEPYLQPSSSYAETLRRWRASFTKNMMTLDPARYDDRFRRMWIYYFALCEAMFDGCGFQVGHFVFEKA